MLQINIVGVVTYSDNCTHRLVACIIGSFSTHFIITLHSSIAATSASKHNKKLKLNKMLSILVDTAAANEQLTVNITSNSPQYC